MKILCISDQIDPLIYSDSVQKIFGDVDIVLCAGDLSAEYINFVAKTLAKPTYYVFGNHNLQDLSFMQKSTLRANIDVTAQKGTAQNGTAQKGTAQNCTTQKGTAQKGTAQYLGFKMLAYNNFLIAGASGSEKRGRVQKQFSEKEMKKKLKKMIPHLILNKIKYGRYLDLFLSYFPPITNNQNSSSQKNGFSCYNWFIKKFKPKFVIHGHIHLYDIQDIRVSKIESTNVINAFSHYLLDTNLTN